MNTQTIGVPSPENIIGAIAKPSSPKNKYVKKYALQLKLLSTAQKGSLKITMPDGHVHEIRAAAEGADADITVHDERVLKDLLFKGDIGCGENYMRGAFDTSDLPKLLEFVCDNLNELDNLIKNNFFYRSLYNIAHFLNRNTKNGSRKNISEHYDLGNDFYELWLDESMTYSSGIYNSLEESLKKSQDNKYERILELLAPGEKILEIGCGWGGFAKKATQAGYAIDCITLSKEQAAYAKERLKNSAANIEIIDYRDKQGKYDNIVSIEMFEAVGEKYWPSYFDSLKNHLKKNGRAVIQTITIRDDLFDKYAKKSDFIQRHIFPGGMLPSDRKFTTLARKSGLRTKSKFEFGESYAATLLEWLKNFDDVKDKVQAQGFDEKFMHKWRFYLSYCYAGFITGRINVVQYELAHA